jgi:hypothetical protein
LELDFEMLSLEKAVQLFKQWGFLVEQGPRQGEVTLVLEGSGHRSYYVCETEKLPEMAKSVLLIRWYTGAMTAPVLENKPVCR